jgi:hypothetical protein
MKSEWKDLKHFSQIAVDKLIITVSTDEARTAYELNCAGLQIEGRKLESTEREKAKKEALNLCRRRARAYYLGLRAAMGLKQREEI